MDEPVTTGVRRVISVTGKGRTTRRPDQADLSLSAEVTAANAGDAQRQASEWMQAILAANLGPIIDAAVDAGATGITDVTLGLADPAEAEAEARRMAVADARTQAEGLAAAAGVTLGPLLKLEAVAASSPPRPMMRMAAEAAATPIAEGSTEVVVMVLASYAIGD